MTSQPSMEIREIRLSELHPASYNPRKKLKKGDKEYEKIKQSLLKFGYVDPIIVNKDLTVIGGHQRLTVLKDLDYETAKCVIVDLSKEDEKALNIALNKITGQWDDQLLADLLLDLQESDFNLDLTGFEPPEIDDILSNIHDKDLSDDDFDVEEELKKPTFSKRGDIWQLGKHRVICGDSTKAETYDQLLGDKKANLVVTDPPYNVDVEETAGKILNDNMPDSDFYQFLFTMFTQVEKHMEADASIYVFHADTEGLNFRKAFKDAGFYLSGCCIWKKNSLVLGRSPYQWQHEPCQPAGTVVQTINGPVPIEDLKDGDRVISYNSYSGTILGMRNGGYEIKTASRYYNGTLYGIKIGNKLTWATDNHQFSVRFNESTKNNYCTYLMRKGDRWRVGITELYNSRGFGLKTRLRGEKGEEAWVIDVFDDKVTAQCHEQLLALKYGIPYTHWEMDRGLPKKETQRTTHHVDMIYDNLDSQIQLDNARRLLVDYGRNIKYPLIHKGNGHEAFSKRVTARINACNLIPQIMQVPIPKTYEKETKENFYWGIIDEVLTKGFSGPVYSLAVEKYEHYIADGIVTHNCLYGWKQKGKHQWFSDRKQTTIWEYDRPKSSKDHPTMKPIPLMAYPIQNSSMRGTIVLDPFLGSGSTLMAADQTGRVCYGIELDEKFVDVIVKRYIESTGNHNVTVLRDGQTLTFDEAYSVMEVTV